MKAVRFYGFMALFSQYLFFSTELDLSGLVYLHWPLAVKYLYAQMMEVRRLGEKSEKQKENKIKLFALLFTWGSR